MNKRELERRRTDILEELDSDLTGAISELNKLNDDLSDLQDLVDSLEERYDELPENEQGGLSEALRRIVNEVQDVESPSGLLEYESDIEEAYKNPIIESVQRNILDFYKIIGIKFSEDEQEKLLQKVNAAAQPNLRHTQEITADLPERVESLPEPAIEALKQEIYTEPSPVSDPVQIESAVKSIEERYQTLQQINDQFDRVDWSPEKFTEITESVEFYYLNTNAELLLGFAPEIEESIEKVPTVVPVQVVIKNHMVENMEELKTDPERVLDEIRGSLSSITARSSEIDDISQLLDIVDIEQDEIQFLVEFDDITTDPPNDIGELAERISSVCMYFEDWKEKITTRWENLRPVIKTYETRLDLSPPEQVSEFSDQGLPLQNQVARAYSAYIRAESWIDAKQDDVLDQVSEEAQEIFYKLSSKGELELSKEDLDAVEELIEIIDIKIVIDE